MKGNKLIHGIITEKKAIYDLPLNISPIGNKVELYYLHPLLKLGKAKRFVFQSRVFVGTLLSDKKKGLSSTITLENIIKKKIIKLKVYYYSPLLIEIQTVLNIE